MPTTTNNSGAAAPVSISSEVPLTNEAERLEAAGFDPKQYVIVGEISTAVTARGVTYKFKVLRNGYDLSALHALAARPLRLPYKLLRNGERAAVLSLADLQLGKVGSRGSTPDAIARSARVRARVIARLRKSKPSLILLADVGDGIEGFNSGGNPMRTNDLSLAEMLDAYASELWLWIVALARIARVEVLIVPSNHADWRNGKMSLGKPSDDLGIYVHRQVQKLAVLTGLDVTFHYPATEYDETVVVDILGTKVGVAHGHQHGPGSEAAVMFWQKQTFGSQALAEADIYIEGHYHHWWAKDVSETKKAFGSPTLDNGSDWFRNIGGRETKPGLLMFEITRDGGLDEESIAIIRDDFVLAA